MNAYEYWKLILAAITVAITVGYTSFKAIKYITKLKSSIKMLEVNVSNQAKKIEGLRKSPDCILISDAIEKAVDEMKDEGKKTGESIHKIDITLTKIMTILEERDNHSG